MKTVVSCHGLVNLGKEVFNGQQFKVRRLPEEVLQVNSRTSAVESFTSWSNKLWCAWWWWRRNGRELTGMVDDWNKFVVVVAYAVGFASTFLAVRCRWWPLFF